MRVISGFHKGRRLSIPNKLPVRPTTDMAKEALFNILSSRYDFEFIEVVDLFSGSGNISYEFCSRGTTKIKAVDSNVKCIKFIKKTCDILNLSIQTILADVFIFLHNSTESFDVIFADPPYNMEQIKIEALVRLIFNKNLIKNNGICIIEHSKFRDLSSIENFVDVRNYGSSNFSLFKKKADL